MAAEPNPSALSLYQKTPRHFIADVDKFLRITFGDGQLAAIRTAFKVVLGAAPSGRVRQACTLGAADTVELDQPLTQVMQTLRALVADAVHPLDFIACELATEQWVGTDWATALEAGRSLLSPPVTWLVPSDLQDDLQGVCRQNVVKLPGTGLQPTGRLVNDDYYVRDGLPERPCIYGFRHGGGAVAYPKPLDLSVEVSGTEMAVHLNRPAVVSMLDPLAARRVFCAAG